MWKDAYERRCLGRRQVFCGMGFEVFVVKKKSERKEKDKYMCVCAYVIHGGWWWKEEVISDMEDALSYPASPKVPAVLKFIQQTLCFLTSRAWLRQRRLKL